MNMEYVWTDGNNEVFSGLTPSDTLTPSNTLTPKGSSLLHIYSLNRIDSESKEWEIGSFGTQIGYNKFVHADGLIITIPKEKLTDRNIYISVESKNYAVGDVRGYNDGLPVFSQTFMSDTPVQEASYEISQEDFEEITEIEVMFYGCRVDRKDTTTIYYKPIEVSNLAEMKPMLTCTTTRQPYARYNDYTIDLGVTEPLRFINEVVRDKLVIENNNATITRKIRVDEYGNLVERETPLIQNLGYAYIYLVEGNNYIDIVDYQAICYARWVIVNEYTNIFATSVELESSITQMANSINLQVMKKVNNDEIIARINMAVLNKDDVEIPDDINNSIIQISADKIQIDSKKFHLTPDGQITATAGYLANWNIEENKLTTEGYSTFIPSELDYKLLESYIRGNSELSNLQMYLYDLNDDNVLNVLDLVLMRNIINGTEQSTKRVHR